MIAKANCLIVAGEKSGEEHALSFLPYLKDQLPHIHFWGVGGDEMAEIGVELVYHLKDFSTWGIWEAIKKIPYYKQSLDDLVTRAQVRDTKVAILVDFQDFNMRLAKRLSASGVKVLYFVAPQVWAWRANRLVQIKRNIHQLYCILPFEENWFKQRGVENSLSVPHPQLRIWEKELLDFHEKSNPKIFIENKIKRWSTVEKNENQSDLKGPRIFRLLLLPGSRNFEVKELWSIFQGTALLIEKYFAKHCPEVSLEVGLVFSPNIHQNYFENSTGIESPLKIFSHHQLNEACLWGDIALAASGTVTLTTALFCLPTIVCYRSGLFNEFLFYQFVKYNGYISLTNLILEEEVFPEIVQNHVSAPRLRELILEWFLYPQKYREVCEKLFNVYNKLAVVKTSPGQLMEKVIEKAYEFTRSDI